MDSRRPCRLPGVPAAALILAGFLLLQLSSAAFQPATNILLNCGSTETATPPDDSRPFVPDSRPNSVSLSGTSSLVTSAANSSAGAALYRTARVTPGSFSYEFALSSSGDHVLRLHFFPFSAADADLFSAVFQVSAQGDGGGILLLQNFAVGRGGAVIKEFFLRVSSGKLGVTFKAAPPAIAFVSAVEVFTAPAELLVVDGRWSGLSEQVALETVHRVNMGGPLITPFNDTLWRRWVPDESFIAESSLAKSASTSATINYATDGGGPTEEVAPARVYSTAKEMNRESVQDPQINITWRFNVSGGAAHLVRMHFCDIVSNVSRDLYFNTYVDRKGFYLDLNLADRVAGVPLAPYYYQSIVEDGAVGSSRVMLVTVGRSQKSTPSVANAILNGLEIMKVVNVTGGGAAGGSKSSSATVVIAAVVGGVVLVLVLVALVLLRVRRRRRIRQQRAQSDRKETGMSLWSPLPGHSTVSGVSSGGAVPGSIAGRQAMNLGLVIPLDEIRAATNDFDESLIVGAGGFGNVYRGELRDGTKVAVKRATPGASQGYPEFQAEVLLLSKIRHKHLVSLVGYCDEQSQMILVYEYMENGTLKSFLYGGATTAPPWKQRLEICVGAARGIHYLHTGDAQAIIHRDLKTSNILLDGDLVAKVSDFGLSRAGPAVGMTHVSTTVKGSFGYFDPEYFRTQQLTDKSDVYSFGVVLLEVLCARPVIDQQLGGDQLNLAEWAIICHRRGQINQIIDPRLKAEPSISAASLKKFAETAIRCVEPYGDNRPAIGDVLWNLEYCLQLQRSGETKREPFEDSGVVETQFPVPVPLRRIPSASGVIGEEEDDEEAPIAGDRLDFTASKAFSQLITHEGR